MGNYKLYKEIGISIEDIYSQVRYIESCSGQRVSELNAAMDIIETRCNTLLDNRMGIFDSRELIELRNKLDDALNAEVSTKLYRSIGAIKKKTEKMYKKLPFIYHGVIIGPIKLTVIESFAVVLLAVVSLLIIQLL